MPCTKLLVVFGITALSIFITQYMKKQRNKNKQTQICQYKCISTTPENYKCVEHVYKNLSCGDTCSNVYLKTILATILSAKETISLCVYHLTLESVGTVMLEAHKRDVKVRIITDYEMSFSPRSQMTYLKNNGIDVRTPPQTFSLLHRKFCLIDEKIPHKAKVLFGTMNYTIKGLCNNCENITCTDNVELVRKFCFIFENLWENFC